MVPVRARVAARTGNKLIEKGIEEREREREQIGRCEKVGWDAEQKKVMKRKRIKERTGERERQVERIGTM